jgi:tRNA(Ile)-lysidine synthase
VANLARTARLLAQDTELLDALADKAFAEALDHDGLDVGALAAMPAALRGRVLHQFARSLGAPGSALSSRHVAALDALVTDWHGQGAVSLPSGIRVARRGSRLGRVTD